ncbi:uncharacterized protein TNCV_4993071 [Trichonephila clavipes]|nr:uncharacterized protein TNCV_4993071 [Trichonephila clavipes]
MKEVAEESMKRTAVEENSSSPDNLLMVSGEGTWKTSGHSSLISMYCNRGRNMPYGDDHLIQKIECVGYVQKRMGSRLRKLKLVYGKKKLSDGRTIGAKSRLTDSLIAKLAHYYGNAIRCNSTSVKKCGKPFGMFGVILAALMMNRCTGFVLQIQILDPVFADLSHPALLKKCLGGKTHNPNESLNSLICKFCPKTIGSSLQIAEIAANLATSIFNDGNQKLSTILEKFGLKLTKCLCVTG